MHDHKPLEGREARGDGDGLVVYIACCPEHGECFVCGGEVEQVPIVPITRPLCSIHGKPMEWDSGSWVCWWMDGEDACEGEPLRESVADLEGRVSAEEAVERLADQVQGAEGARCDECGHDNGHALDCPTLPDCGCRDDHVSWCPHFRQPVPDPTPEQTRARGVEGSGE